MNHKSFPLPGYEQEMQRLNAALQALKKRKDTIAWSRFGTIVLLAAAVYFLYPLGLAYAAIAAVVLGALFIRLVILAVNNKTSIDNTGHLLAINQQEIQIATEKSRLGR